MTYSDQYLRDFLNNVLPAEKTREIETAMLSDTELEKRIMSLDSFSRPVRDLMHSIPNQDRLTMLAETLVVDSPSRQIKLGWQALAIGAVFAFVIGWVGNSVLRDNADNWRMEVARYQALYVKQTIAHLNRDPAKITSQFERASSAIGLMLPQQTLAGIPGLELARAQVLGFKHNPLIQVVFQTTNGTPIAFCIIAKQNGNATDSPTFSTMQGLASAAWETDSHQFLLIGGANQQEIMDWTAQFKSLFQG